MPCGLCCGFPCRAKLPIESIRTVAAAGDVLNITSGEGSPDLLLQLSGAEAIAEAFRMHKLAHEVRSKVGCSKQLGWQSPRHSGCFVVQEVRGVVFG